MFAWNVNKIAPIEFGKLNVKNNAPVKITRNVYFCSSFKFSSLKEILDKKFVLIDTWD